MSDWPRVRFDLIRALCASFVLVVVGCSQPPAPGDSPAGTTVAGTKGAEVLEEFKPGPVVQLAPEVAHLEWSWPGGVGQAPGQGGSNAACS